MILCDSLLSSFWKILLSNCTHKNIDVVPLAIDPFLFGGRGILEYKCLYLFYILFVGKKWSCEYSERSVQCDLAALFCLGYYNYEKIIEHANMSDVKYVYFGLLLQHFQYGDFWVLLIRFQVKKKQFFRNFVTIVMFGALGTLISFIIISLGMPIFLKFITLNFQQCRCSFLYQHFNFSIFTNWSSRKGTPGLFHACSSNMTQLFSFYCILLLFFVHIWM